MGWSASASSSFSSCLFSACLVSLLLLCFSTSNKAYFAYANGGEETHFHTLQVTSLLPPTGRHACKFSPNGRHEEGESLTVFHSHGPCSPHKANSPILTEILSQDQSRVNSIQSRVAFRSGQSYVLRNSQANLPANSGLSLGTLNYVVRVSLGTPKKDLSLIFDTGSDLTWTQCRPCVRSCYTQKDPIFNPSMSRTYRNITCNSSKCSQLVSATGVNPGCSSSTCIYGIQYGDQSFSIGFFGTDTLTLTSTDTFPNFFFGCGQNNRGLFGSVAGLLGLGRDPLSLVSQTASKFKKYFSYCLPSSSSSTGHLTFGKKGSIGALKFTPFSANPRAASFYFIDVTGIRVGRQRLPIELSVFQEAGMVIDSGTVITRLPPTAYAAMRASFRKQMESYPLTSAQSILDTCYDLSQYSSVSIPRISFFFAVGVEVPLTESGILFGTSLSQVCLAFAANSNDSDVGIFGNLQQRTLEVAYDIAAGKLGFGTAGCS